MGIYCNCPPSAKGKQVPAFEQLAQGHTGNKSEIRNWDLDPSDILSFLQHTPCSLWGLETLLELGNHKSCYRTLETPHRIQTPRRNVWSYWCCCADINHNRAIQKRINQPWAPLPLEFLTKGTRGASRMYLETAVQSCRYTFNFLLSPPSIKIATNQIQRLINVLFPSGGNRDWELWEFWPTSLSQVITGLH